jgi:hypothetical protein
MLKIVSPVSQTTLAKKDIRLLSIGDWRTPKEIEYVQTLE